MVLIDVKNIDTVLPSARGDAFVTTWKTTLPFDSIIVGTTGDGYNFEIDR